MHLLDSFFYNLALLCIAQGEVSVHLLDSVIYSCLAVYSPGGSECA